MEKINERPPVHNSIITPRRKPITAAHSWHRFRLILRASSGYSSRNSSSRLQLARAKRRLPRVRKRRLTDRQSWDSPNVVSVPSFSPRLPTTHQSALFVATPFPFSPIAVKHRERQRGCALRHGGLLLRFCACAGFGSSRFAGTLQESRPWHLGAASRSRPPGGVP